MLHNKVIIYDDSCPMCKLYTYWFVAWGFLKPENRIGFATAPPEITAHVDLDLGRHEIPLYDRSTHETIYGLRALTIILGHRWTWLRPLFASRPFWWLFYPIYQIITYNRRVMAGCGHCGGFDCAPDLNRLYRGLYLLATGLLTSAFVVALAASSTPYARLGTGLVLGFVTIGLITGAVVRLANGSLSAWNHFGNRASVLLIMLATLSPLVVWPTMPEVVSWTVIVATCLLCVEEIFRRQG